MVKTVEERARELAKERTNYGGQENPSEEMRKYYETPTGRERDKALRDALISDVKKDFKQIKKSIKKKAEKVKSYFSKNKNYANKPRKPLYSRKYNPKS